MWRVVYRKMCWWIYYEWDIVWGFVLFSVWFVYGLEIDIGGRLVVWDVVMVCCDGLYIRFGFGLVVIEGWCWLWWFYVFKCLELLNECCIMWIKVGELGYGSREEWMYGGKLGVINRIRNFLV